MLILDATGRPLADSAGPDRADDTYVGRPEVAAALSGKSVQGTRHSDTLDEDLLYTAVPVLDKGQTVGAVRLTQSVDGVNSTIRRDRLALAGVGLGALILGLVVAWLVAGTLARPLQDLAGTARRIADGDLAARAPIEGAEEQRAVAGAFNMMTDRLVRSLEAQRDFVANASHQLRTPLTGLKLRLEAAGIQTDDPAVQRELAAAEREADRLARLVSDLLALAAADAPAAEPEPVDLRAAAQRRRGALLAPRGRHVAVDRARRGAAGLRVGVVRRRRDGARQPDRERAHPHAARDADRARGGHQRAAGVGRRARRRPRPRAGGPRAGVRAVPARRAPEARCARAPGSGWRSPARSRSAGAAAR